MIDGDRKKDCKKMEEQCPSSQQPISCEAQCLTYKKRHSNRAPRCICCSKQGVFLCGTCKHVVYCSEACQKEDWQRHKRCCSKDRNAAFKTLCQQIDCFLEEMDVKTRQSNDEKIGGETESTVPKEKEEEEEEEGHCPLINKNDVKKLQTQYEHIVS